MYHETKQSERSAGPGTKFYVVPAVILAGWLMMVGSVVASMGQRPALHSSIETVLKAPNAAQPATMVAFARVDKSHQD